MSSDLRHHLAGVLSAGRSPLLLLQSSDGAELIARKNGLSVAALLAPFCALKNVSIPVRAGEFAPLAIGAAKLFATRAL